MIIGEFLSTDELYGLKHGRIMWDLGLPSYAPAENIGVNVKRLGGIARWGGFNSLTVNSYHGETTQVMGEIDSVRPDGTAVARRIGGIAKATVQKSELPDYPGDLPDHSYYWPDATLSLNTNEIEDRLDQKRKLKDPAAWSRELDSALKISVRDATYKHLLLEGRPVREKAGIVTKPLALTLGLEAINYVGKLSLESSPQSFLLLYIMCGGTLDKTSDFLLHRPIRKGRFSIFHGLQLDRVAAVEGLTRALPIMKKIAEA